MNWRTLKRVCVGSNWRNTLVRAAILAIVVFTVCTKAFKPFTVQGESMAPTYTTGDFGFINLLAYRWSEPERFDVVAVTIGGTRIMFLKRVVGLPGEKIEIRNGVVHVDGEPLDERYVRFNAGWVLKEQSVGMDEYFVVGDNRGMPIEQHRFGAVKRSRIAGRM